MAEIVQLIAEKIHLEPLQDNLQDPTCGGMAIFEGRVRNHHGGKPVHSLYYECYAPMAIKVLREIAREAVQQWQLGRLSVVHRYGLIPIGETAVWIGVASSHRRESFAACQYLIEEIKKRVPIWKKETYQDGSHHWVACHHASG